MLVTAAELVTYMQGIVLTTEQTTFVEEIVLPGVQQELETYLGRPVEAMHVREARTPDSEGFIFLTVTPVWEVLSFNYGSDANVVVPTTYKPAALTLTAPGVSLWDPAQHGTGNEPWGTGQANYINLFDYSPVYIGRPTQVLVEYIGGYNGHANESLKLGIMRVAAREVGRLFDNTIGLLGGSGQAAQEGDRREKGWTEAELKGYDRMRRRVVA